MPTTFTDEEMKALKVLVDYAAEGCREDTIGAILYTGAFLCFGSMQNESRDDSICELAKKIDGK